MANPSASPLSPPSSSSANQGPILQFAPFNSIVDDGFWRRFSALKLDTLRIDQSPIPISGFFAPCSHSSVSNYLTLLSESLPSDSNIQSPSVPVKGNRNKCPIPGTLLNTNTLESFRALEKEVLLKAEAKRVGRFLHI